MTKNLVSLLQLSYICAVLDNILKWQVVTDVKRTKCANCIPDRQSRSVLRYTDKSLRLAERIVADFDKLWRTSVIFQRNIAIAWTLIFVSAFFPPASAVIFLGHSAFFSVSPKPHYGLRTTYPTSNHILPSARPKLTLTFSRVNSDGTASKPFINLTRTSIAHPSSQVTMHIDFYPICFSELTTPKASAETGSHKRRY